MDTFIEIGPGKTLTNMIGKIDAGVRAYSASEVGCSFGGKTMLNGKVAVVTGASRGIGKAIAKKLASLGADIAVIYAGNTEAAEAVCGECIENFGIRSKAYRCDVSDYEMTKRITSEIKADFGTVNILVNNAGITRDGLVAMMKEDDF